MAADRAALRLRRAVDAIVVVLASTARRWVDVRGWTAFGFARCDDHALERLGRTGRAVRDLAALGDGLRRMPALADALVGADGAEPIGRTAATLIARVAAPDSLDAWLRLARSHPVRDLRRAVAAARESGSRRPVRVADGEPGALAPAGDGGVDGATDAARDDRDDDEPRRSVVLAVPREVRAAFDEAVELHRAVEGREAGVASFVEALAAEAFADGCSPDVDSRPVRRGSDDEAVESMLARSTGRWAFLGAGDDDSLDDPLNDDASTPLSSAGARADLSACRAALTDLRRLEQRLDPGEPQTAESLDAGLRELIALEERLQLRLTDLLVEMGERGQWATLMFRGVGHYAEQRLGLARSTVEGRVRLQRALRRLPRLAHAYRGGEVGAEAAWQVVRAVGGRALDAQVEDRWVARARGATVKRLRDEARVLRHGVDADGELLDGAPLDDAAWHASLRRNPGDTRRRVLRLGLTAVDRFTPDVFLRLRLPATVAAQFVGAIEHTRRRLTGLADSVPWYDDRPDPGALPSLRAARTFSSRCRRVPAWVGLLGLIEDYAITWDDPRAAGRRSAEAVYRRDGWRCMAPGCSSRRNLEEHHIVYRSRGGGNEQANRVCLCRFHHQLGQHGGLASCRGLAPLGVVWRLGLRRLATWWRNERRLPMAAAM